MKQIIAFFVFFSTIQILSFGQQTDGIQKRKPDAVQMIEQQRGELEYFKTLVYRFEIAWEETDIQSMIDLRDGLLKLMSVEIQQLTERSNPSLKAIDRLAAEKSCLKKVESNIISESDNAMGKQAEATKKLFNEFISLLEADFVEQVEALRLAEK